MTSSVKKYLVFGDMVFGRKDKDLHYVPAIEVARLYKVNINSCILIDRKNEDMKLKGLDTSKYIKLYPQYDGNYDLRRLLNE